MDEEMDDNFVPLGALEDYPRAEPPCDAFIEGRVPPYPHGYGCSSDVKRNSKSFIPTLVSVPRLSLSDDFLFVELLQNFYLAKFIESGSKMQKLFKNSLSAVVIFIQKKIK